MEWHDEESEPGAAATGTTSPFVRGATAAAAAAAAVTVYSLMDFVGGEPIELIKYSVLGLVVFTVIVAQETLSKQSYR